MIRALIWAALAAVVGITAFGVLHPFVSAAYPHDWYPPRCCGGASTHGDCAPLEGLGAVQRRDDGWFIPLTGETIPFSRAEPSQDLRFHRGVYQHGEMKGKTRCLFAPDTAG